MTVASDPAFVPGKIRGDAKDASRWNCKIQIAFGSAMLTLLIVGGISYRAMMVSYESAKWVRHTHEVLDTLKDHARRNVEHRIGHPRIRADRQ